MKLTIELSETQAYILRDALDGYSRNLAGQVSVAVMDAVNYMALRKGHKIDTYSLRTQLGDMQALITGLDYGASFGIYAPEIPDRARQAYDLQQVIRHAVSWHLNPDPKGLSTVDFDTPRRTSEKEELAKCQIEDSTILNPVAVEKILKKATEDPKKFLEETGSPHLVALARDKDKKEKP